MVSRASGLAALAMLLLAGCAAGPAPRVRAADHEAFFLWAGVRPPAALAQARVVYVLAGEVREADPGRLVPLRPEPPRARHADIWLTIRLERLDLGEGVYDSLATMLRQWQAASGRLVGVQVDFDAGSRSLDRYAEFLSGFREWLPEELGLSITGLMDWSASGDPPALAQLAVPVDEIVVQTYRSTTTIDGYEAYLQFLPRLGMPHRLALVEGGEWQEPEFLASDERFLGYVVFLLDDRGDRR